MLRFSTIFFLLSALVFAAKNEAALPERYKEWLKHDVIYIISSAERKTFLSLASDAARDSFMENFWAIRNPNRGAKENAFKEEHYRRLQYATDTFGRMSNTPGWMTDEGRTWIIFGKPQSSASYKGYGQLYPIDLWFYSNNTGSRALPAFFYVMFFIPEDIGEYRFYRPHLDGPLKLVRGSQFNSNRSVYEFLKPISGDLARAAFTLIANDPIDRDTFTTDLGSDMLVSHIQNFANDPSRVSRLREAAALESRVTSTLLLEGEQRLNLTYLLLTDPLGRQWLDYGITIDNAHLGGADAGTQQLKVSSAYQLYTATGELIVEDAEERAYPAFTSGSGDNRQFTPFVLANRLPVAPGEYRLDVQITNRQAGRTFKGSTKFTAGTPKNGLAITGPLIATEAEQSAHPDAVTPFQYFGVQFHPAANHQVTAQEQLRLLFQVSALAPADYDVEYALANIHIRESRRLLTDPVGAAEFRNGSFLKAKTIPLTGLEQGDYLAVVSVHPRGGRESLASATVPFTISDKATVSATYFLEHSRNMATPGVAAYIRGLEASSQKNEEASVGYMQEALDQNPGNAFAGNYLVQSYFKKRQFAAVTALYKKLGISLFEKSPQSLAQITLSFWESGDKAQARDLLAAARGYFPRDPAIAAASRTVQ